MSAGAVLTLNLPTLRIRARKSSTNFAIGTTYSDEQVAHGYVSFAFLCGAASRGGIGELQAPPMAGEANSADNPVAIPVFSVSPLPDQIRARPSKEETRTAEAAVRARSELGNNLAG